MKYSISEDVRNQIIELLVEGHSLGDVLALQGMPTRRQFKSLLRSDFEFRERYLNYVEWRRFELMEESLQIVDNVGRHWSADRRHGTVYKRLDLKRCQHRVERRMQMIDMLDKFAMDLRAL